MRFSLFRFSGQHFSLCNFDDYIHLTNHSIQVNNLTRTKDEIELLKEEQTATMLNELGGARLAKFRSVAEKARMNLSRLPAFGRKKHSARGWLLKMKGAICGKKVFSRRWKGSWKKWRATVLKKKKIWGRIRLNSSERILWSTRNWTCFCWR